MKKMIKHPKKMKNAMYIVFGVFALALFAITRIHPSYANEGLMIDDALDAIVLYGEVEQLPEDEEVEEVQDEEIQDVEEEEDIIEPGETTNEEIAEEEKTSEDLDETILERDNKEIDKSENKEEPQDKEENHGVSDENGDNEENKQEQKVEEEVVCKNKEGNVESSEEFGFKSPENKITEEIQLDKIESEEIYGTGEYEGVKVEVYAQTGAFPKGTILSIVPITGDNEISDIQDVLEEQKNVEKTEKLIAFDITFLDPETNEELQPLTGTVQVSFNYEENEELKAAEQDEEQEVKVYHLNDKDEEGKKIEEIKDVVVEEVVVNEEESEKEGVMVIDTEKFSIYAIIKGATNVGNTITITYNANGGNFKTGNNQFVEEIMVTYTKQSNGNYTSNINLQAPNRSNYMFAGWYTTSSNQSTERYGQVDDTTENSKKVYAKWLTFNDLTITTAGVTFTLMDRNLGATYSSYSNSSSYGFFYQRGNNYGFKNSGELPYVTSNTMVNDDNTNWGPGNYYSNSSFNKTVYSFRENYENLRGGANTSNPDKDRQGPCPDGYHVPDRYEWNYAYKLMSEQCNSWSSYGNCFRQKLKLPYAGDRWDQYESYNIGSYAFYRTSTPGKYDGTPHLYDFSISNYSEENDVPTEQFKHAFTYAMPVRCFKNSREEDMYKLIYSGDNGIDDTIYNMRWREPITEDYRPEDPINGNLGFLGWYPYENGQYGDLFHFNKEIRIKKDTVLKARWGETNPVYTYDANGGYFENGENEVEIEHQIDEGYYERIENLQIPNKTGYMFVGWYTTSGDGNYNNQTEEWIGQVDCEVQNTNRIYAKWLPFNDLTVTMSGITFTIMDRNLGAEETAEGTYFNSNDIREDPKKLGFFYQWGNNYGFNNSGDFPKISNIQRDITGYGPRNYYYSNYFISPEQSQSWSSTGNKNLRGGETPVNKDTDKQGPCPKGYHIPNKLEWEMVDSLYNGQAITEYCNGSTEGCLNHILKLPYMGEFFYDTMEVKYKFLTTYWTSSPSNNNINSAVVKGSSNDYGIAFGLPVRCFKDSKIEDTVPLIYSGDNGTEDIIYNMRRWEPVTELYIPEEPVKEGYSFIGWYIYENGECGKSFDYTAGKILSESLIMKAKWGKQGQVFEYNANGGVFKNGSEKIEIEHEIINGRYEEKTHIEIPSRTGYMFAGWYIESGDYTNQITEWENGWTPIHDISKIIYAKWLPFNDLTVTMSGVTLTIMDRNLGASAYMNQGGKESSEWNGSYYQWGNNYGFKNSGNMRYVDDTRVDADVYDKTGGYYSNVFKNISSSPNRWTINDNKNLWGGGKEKSGDINKQGPCPAGYHIPDQNEWLSVISIFKSQKNFDSDFCDGTLSEGDCFSSKLKLPYAGFRNYQGILHNGSSYWSSTPRNDYGAFYLYFSQYSSLSDQSYNTSNRVQAYPIRCFKDSAKIVYHPNGGTEPSFPTNVLKFGDKTFKLSNSIRTGYTFEGWYKTIDLIEGTEVYDNNIPTNDDYVNVYARWGKNPWYIYNANGGSFSGENIQIIKYNSSFTSKNSHTPNLDDEGNKLSDYEDNLDLNEVITLEGANRLHITLTYGGESCCDYVAMWTGAYPDYKANVSDHYKTSFLSSNGYLYGGNHDNPENTKEYYVSGDTVTIAYHSDSSSHGDGYGYYAVISNPDESDKVMYYTFEEVIPERTGYNFLGWYETGATELFDITGTKVTQDRTLYAKWEANTYTVSFNANNGENNPENITVTYDSQYSELPVVNKTGYIFLGWYNGENVVSSGDIVQITGDVELKAKREIDQYKIIFDTDGGNEISPIEKDYNSVINITLPTPIKECNAFSGWDIELPERMPAHDVTLKAIWEYTCSRSSGGGGGAKKSESPTREIAIGTPTDQEHNSADEEQKTETSSNSENTNNQEIVQEIAIDGGTQKTVVVRNTDIVATVRNTTHSSSSRFTKEENDAYSFAKSNGITTTDSIETAKMNTSLTRIEMAKMLSNFAINVLGQEPDVSKGTVKFNDVTNKMDDQYDNAVIKAYQLGIMGQNMKNNEFRPNDEVTRAEFASALSRLLYQTEEGEYKGTSKYYIPHVAKLYNEGIINKTDPKIKEKRGYVMTMLMRTVQ